MRYYLRIAVLMMSIVALPTIAAQAQTGGTGSQPGSGGTYQDPANRSTYDDNDRDWGWLGLLGLAGLAGLMRRREEPVRNRVNSTVTDR